MNRMMSGWLTSGRSTKRSTAKASANMTPMVRRERDERRNAVRVQADQRQRREHHHDALREIEHAGGLEDQHEAERDQRIEHAGDQPLPQRLREQIGRAAHLHEGIDEDLVEKVHGVGPQCATPR